MFFLFIFFFLLITISNACNSSDFDNLFSNDLTLVKSALASKANINAEIYWERREQMVTPLGVALIYGNKELVKFLLESKANPNAGLTILNKVYHIMPFDPNYPQLNEGKMGVLKTKMHFLEKLIEYGADVNHMDFSYRCLCLTLEGSLMFLSVVKKFKLDINPALKIRERCLNNRNVFMSAVFYKYGKLVKALFEYDKISGGIDYGQLDSDGKSAFELAKIGNNLEIVNEFQNYASELAQAVFKITALPIPVIRMIIRYILAEV